MDENKTSEEEVFTKVKDTQEATSETSSIESSNGTIIHNVTQLEFDDYWAHKISEAAKKKVVTYFAVLGILVSVIITLFGMDRIRALVDEQYVNRLEAKEKQASERVDLLAKKFEEKLEALQNRLETRSQEFHRIVGITLSEIQTGQVSISGVQVDLTEEIGPIMNQGQYHTSVGFAFAYTLSAEYKRKTGKSVIFSAQSIFVEARKYDEWPGEQYKGTSVLGAVKGLTEVGAYLESDWPYERKGSPLPHKAPVIKIKSYTRIQSDQLDQVINFLKEGKPVIVTLNATKDFAKVGQDGKIFFSEDLNFIGNHVLCFVGYNGVENEFKFANSWGKSWGNSGFGYIRQSDLQKIMTDAFIISI